MLPQPATDDTVAFWVLMGVTILNTHEWWVGALSFGFALFFMFNGWRKRKMLQAFIAYMAEKGEQDGKK
jgi:hypothetical protein